ETRSHSRYSIPPAVAAWRRRLTHIRGFANRRSAKPFDCEQWEGTPGLANYSGATTSPGAATTRYHADNFVRCDHPSTGSRARTMNKRNTLVGPQLQRGRAGFNPDWKRLIAFVAVIVLGSIVATQILANSYRFHPALGFNLFHVYPPWSYFLWSLQWEQPNNHSLFAQAFGIGSLVTLGGFMLL